MQGNKAFINNYTHSLFYEWVFSYQKNRANARFQICAERGTTFVLRKFPNGNFARTRPRGIRLCLWQNSYIAPGFESLPRAKQFARFCALYQKKPSQCSVSNLRREGLEPSSLAACAPQTHAYTNSATCAKNLSSLFILAKI